MPRVLDPCEGTVWRSPCSRSRSSLAAIRERATVAVVLAGHYDDGVEESSDLAFLLPGV